MQAKTHSVDDSQCRLCNQSDTPRPAPEVPALRVGTFAYPFLEAVWGADGLRLAALYDIPNGLVVFGLAAGVFAAEQRNTLKQARAKSGKHDDGGVYEGEWSVGRVGTPHPVILLAVRLVHSLCL